MPRGLMMVAVAATVAAWAMPARGAPATFSDGTFDAASWTVVVLEDNTVGLTAQLTGWPQAGGGNPGSFRALSNIWSHDGVGSSTVVAGHMRALSDYAPSVDGPIGSISVSLDVSTSQTTYLTEALLGFFPVLKQGNTYYRADLPSEGPADWTTLTWGPSAAADFFVYAGDLNGAAHPDFSATGAAIVLGVAVQSGPHASAGTFMTEGGMDNWSVAVAAPSADDGGVGGAGGQGSGSGNGSSVVPPTGIGPAVSPPRDDGGCGCRLQASLPGSQRPTSLCGLMAIAALALARRRRG
jgi:hypothetical protein